MNIKLLPGLLSYYHFFEMFVYLLILIMFFVPNIFLIGIYIVFVLSVSIFRIFFFFEENGSELYIKVKKRRLYVFRDLFFYKSYLLNENTIVYKTKILGVEHGFNIARVIPGKPTSEEDGLSRRNAFIIVRDNYVCYEKLQYKYANNGMPISCKKNFYITYELLKNKNIIMLAGNKSNYYFLRQYLKKEQFHGQSHNDNQDLVIYETLFENEK